MTFPSFAKLGTVLSAPAWMVTAGIKPMFGVPFDNDAVRGTLPGVPATSFSLLFSSDHATGVGDGSGYCGRADTNDIEALPWTDSGNYIHNQANELETYWPVYDPANSRIIVGAHHIGSTVPFALQQSIYLTTTDLATLTAQDPLFNYGHHNGYSAIYRLAADDWRAFHSMIGGESGEWGVSYSTDGVVWTLAQRIATNARHILAPNRLIHGVMSAYQYGGSWWAICLLATRPRIGTVPDQIVAIKLSDDWTRLVGGPHVLLTPTALANDNSFFSLALIFDSGGNRYLFYSGRDTLNADHILLAKADGGTVSETAPDQDIDSAGTIVSLKAVATDTDADWDASVDDIPAAFSVVVRSGSSTSAQGAGHYLMKTGAAGAQDIYLRTAATVTPSNFKAVRFRVEGLKFSTGAATPYLIQAGFADAFAPNDAATIVWSESPVTSRPNGHFLQYKNAALVDTQDWSLPYNSNLSDEGRDWARSESTTLEVVIHEDGARMTVFVDDVPAYSRDISANVDWGTPVFAFVRIISTGQSSAQFTRARLLTQIDAPDIAVLDPDTNPIADGETTPYDFGTATEGGSAVSKAFTIQNNGTATLTISTVTVPTGYEVDAGSQVPSGGTTITASSSKTLTVNLLSASAGTKSGDITINSDDPDTAAFNFAVTGEVVLPAPTVSAIDPTTATRGSTGDITVTGTDFVDGATATFSGTGVTVNSTTFVSSTELTANLTVAADAALTARNVTVTNPDTQADTLNSALTITAAVPTITRSPSSLSFTATEGGSNPATQDFTVDNTGDTTSTLSVAITDNAAWLSVAPGSADINEDEVANTFTVTVDITGLAAGTYNATITITDAAASNSPQTVAVELVVSAAASGGTLSSGVIWWWNRRRAMK